MDSAKPIDTPISPSTRLVMDDGSPSVEEKSYRGMIGSLLYLVDLTLFSVLVYVPVFTLSLKNHIKGC